MAGIKEGDLGTTAHQVGQMEMAAAVDMKDEKGANGGGTLIELLHLATSVIGVVTKVIIIAIVSILLSRKNRHKRSFYWAFWMYYSF